MVIKNISAKIINVGSEVLMPDMAITVNKTVASAPSIQALAEMGFIKVEEGDADNVSSTKTARKRSATVKTADKKPTENAGKPTDDASAQPASQTV